MKNIVLILAFFGAFLTSSAQSSLVLEKKETSKKEILLENERIKVKTADGNWHVGTFTIVDEKTIFIEDQNILLENITKIKKSKIFANALKGTGTLAIVSGLTVAVGGDFILTGALTSGGLLLRGAGLLIDGGNHKPTKWNYSIVIDPNKK